MSGGTTGNIPVAADQFYTARGNKSQTALRSSRLQCIALPAYTRCPLHRLRAALLDLELCLAVAEQGENSLPPWRWRERNRVVDRVRLHDDLSGELIWVVWIRHFGGWIDDLELGRGHGEEFDPGAVRFLQSVRHHCPYQLAAVRGALRISIQ
jgi:hypothetical protein